MITEKWAKTLVILFAVALVTLFVVTGSFVFIFGASSAAWTVDVRASMMVTWAIIVSSIGFFTIIGRHG